ncbi:MAG: pilus assembly protein PilM [Deltaproteobacteria bacterium]|jgi:type II secretion system protein L|nr:pilus assembly protein PilM [Deltaproteobacteria bacterium]MBW2469655.1 pilus assembly protein PilM [Deltaproteobacteria bacterium]MBW2515796.1 pilus assembly protein PilM [Deltaproteobacteria bacterium]
MSRKILGIDIRNQSLTAVLLNSSLREYHVDDFIHIPYSGPDDPERSLSAALETLKERIDLTGSDFVVSVPAHQFIFRNMQVPFNNAKKIRMVLPFELEPSLPFAVEDLAIDFLALNGAPAGDQTDLIAAAIEKGQLAPYLEALVSVNIDPEKLTLSGLPVAQCLAHQADSQEDLIFIEIVETHATLFVLKGGRMQLIRSFPIPASGPAKTSMLCAQTQQTLAAFQETSTLDFSPIEAVINDTGGIDRKMAEDISKFLEIPVKFASIAEQMSIPLKADTANEWVPGQMENALSLALMEVEGYPVLNFHKGQFAAQKFYAKHKSALIKTGILAAAVVVLMFFNLMMQTHTLNKRIDAINDQMTQIFKETFPEITSVKYPFKEMQAKMREAEGNAAFEDETGPHINRIDIINNISEKIPADITVNLSRLVIQPGNVLISGTTDTYESVNTIKSRLESVQQFEKVTISSANLDRSGKEVQFMLKVQL